MRVLHMLIAHVRSTGNEHLVPALERQIDHALDAVEASDVLQRADVQKLRILARGHRDPAEHTIEPSPLGTTNLH